MGLALETVEYGDHGGGADYGSSPTKTAENKATYSLNMDYTVDGALCSRSGSVQLNLDHQIAGAPRGLGLFDFRKSDGSEYEISAFGTDLYLGYANPIAQNFTLDASLPFPCFEYFNGVNDEYCYYGNGLDANLEFDGTVWRNWSIDQPAAPTEDSQAAGNLPPADYIYVMAYANYDFANEVLIKISQVSDPVTVTVVAGPNQEIVLDIPVSTDPQVNARILYRASQVDGRFYQLIDGNDEPIYLDNDPLNTTYTDNNPVEGTVEANFDIVAVDPTPIFCEYAGRMFYVAQDAMADLRWSEPGEAWNGRETNIALLDGKITAMHRAYGSLIIATDRSIWIQSGDPSDSTSVLKRISSKVGVLNNRCMKGESNIYFLSTSMKVYQLRPTDLTEDEMRIDQPISNDIHRELQKISIALQDYTCMEYWIDARAAKLVISYNIGTGHNNNILVFNELQSQREQDTVWQPWDHMEIAAIKQVQTSHQNRLVFADFNGFLWVAEQSSNDSDGAEINGTATGSLAAVLIDADRPEVTSQATAGGADTLTDAAQVWLVNEFASDQVYIFAGTGSGQTRTIQSNDANTLTVSAPWAIVPDNTSQYTIGGFIVNAFVGQKITLLEGTGADQVRTIVSNTSTEITVDSNWTQIPDATTEFTVGGYDSFHFSNWKAVIESYDALKQLWYLWVNANANGDYNISLILQTDFDTSINNQMNLLVNLSAENAIWSDQNDPSDDPDNYWGLMVWGSRSVFFDRYRVFRRFRAIRVGFRNRRAGQPFQVNTFGISAQNKKLFFRGAA